ncbi:MAG: 30S ribosomal protein S16 [Candidatus Binatia bacterium]|nr:30S ribosomal protein S16 [Candidatus Binatia bacterium]
MATTIRLARHGSKKRPFYRIVVADSRAPRDGRRLDQIGYYDPTRNPAVVHIDEAKLNTWLQRGAQVSLTVSQLIHRVRRSQGAASEAIGSAPQAGEAEA